MAFRYELFILSMESRRFIKAEEETGSVAEAMFNVLMRDTKLCSRMLQIYCKHPHSKNLKYMGLYDGGSGRGFKGEVVQNILTLANGEEYHLTDEGFKKCFF